MAERHIECPLVFRQGDAGPAKIRILELDALRGIAAVSVMLFHYTTIYPTLFPAQRSLGMRFEAGAYGVFLFFAISGFVISLTLSTTAGVREFAVKRFARLFPVYWAAILLTTLVVELSDTELLQTPLLPLLANFTMLQGFFLLPSVDGVYWTLTVELAFYICAVGIWYGIGWRRVELVTLGWLLGSILVRQFDVLPYRLHILLLTQHCAFFILGMLSYRVWAEQRRWRQQLPYILAAFGALATEGGVEWAAVGILIQTMLFGMVKGYLTFLRHPILLALGALSYVLYLIHHHIGFVLLRAVDVTGCPPWLAIILVSAGMCLLAAVVHQLIEVPAERRIRRWWQRRHSTGTRSRLASIEDTSQSGTCD